MRFYKKKKQQNKFHLHKIIQNRGLLSVCLPACLSVLLMNKTRNVSMGHGCPRYSQIRINRALSLTKGHNSNNNRWILSIIELYLYFMITYLCKKYEFNKPTYSKYIAWKPFYIRRSRAVTLVIIG